MGGIICENSAQLQNHSTFNFIANLFYSKKITIPKSQMFSVVKFIVDGSVQVVSTKWLSKNRNTCRWPPGPNPNVTAKAKKHELPSKSWLTYDVKVWQSCGKL